MKLKLRAAAERDLDGIFDYSVAMHGAGSAETYIRDIQMTIERLLKYPELGENTGLRPKLRAVSAREHRIFYRIEGDAIVVARVLHKAMDVQRHL